jgi:hypothetical protein
LSHNRGLEAQRTYALTVMGRSLQTVHKNQSRWTSSATPTTLRTATSSLTRLLSCVRAEQVLALLEVSVYIDKAVAESSKSEFFVNSLLISDVLLRRRQLRPGCIAEREVLWHRTVQIKIVRFHYGRH